MKYLTAIKERYKDKILFTKRDIKILLNHNLKNNYLNLLIHNLVKQKKIRKLAKGAYTFREELEVVGFAYSPFYYGLQDALSYHKLWEQETIPVVITSKKIKPGIRKINDSNVLLKRISRKYLFGIDYIKIKDLDVPISDLEKTYIDMIYYKQPISIELKQEFKNKINIKKFEEHLKNYSLRFQNKVKNYFKPI